MKETKRKSRKYLFLVLVFLFLLVSIFLVRIIGRPTGGRGNFTRDKNTITSLVTACDAYMATYGIQPSASEEYPDHDEIVSSVDPIMSILSGIDLNGKNRRKIPFFTGEVARGGSEEKAYGGLLISGNSAKLYDCWRKGEGQERGYLILFDYDGDGLIENPFEPGEKLVRPAVAWSTGKDGKWERGNPKKGVNKDNVYSWR